MAMKQSAGSTNSVAIDPYPSNNIASGASPTAASNALGLGGAGAAYTRTGGTYTTCSSGYAVGSTLTAIVFVTGSGAEVNLIDQATNGAAYSVPNACTNGSPTWNAGRGTAFHSVDGSMLQFIDSAVLEQNPKNAAHGAATISGTLQFPSGVTYRIDNSNVSWIRDRNGNKITLSYTNGPPVPVNWFLYVAAPTQIVDSLNRTISINYDDSSCSGCVSITYPGWQSASRVIHIATAALDSGLFRSGYGAQTIDQLFPNTGQPTSYDYNPTVASSIQFPDGRDYTFSTTTMAIWHE